MKLRPILILLLFALAAGLLARLYYVAVHGSERSRPRPQAETIADLASCCRRKHALSAQYDHFARVADEEQRADAARLFRAMALSARLQENDCAAVILRLGGSYDPPQRVAVFRGSTDDNLLRSIDYGRHAAQRSRGAEIGRALERGHRQAARALTRAAASDVQHADLMERCRLSGGCGTYLLCPRCGNLYEADRSAPYCPICMTPGERFLPVE